MKNRLFNQIFDDEYFIGDFTQDFLGMALLNKIAEGKVAKQPIHFGDGFYVKRVGHDVNGNWSYWIQRGNNAVKKIEATNIAGGKNKIIDVNDFLNPDYAYTVELIKDYFNRYLMENSFNLNEEDYRIEHYYYVIDSEDYEDQYFAAHVVDTNGNVVYEITNGGDKNDDVGFWIVMDDLHNVEKLEKYLKKEGIIPEYAELFHENEINRNELREFVNNSTTILSAKLENIPETLSYNVEELLVNSQRGDFRIPNAGILSLNVDEMDLINKLMKESNESVVKVDDIKIEQQPSKFRLYNNSFHGNYQISVKYTTEDGEKKEQSLNFDDLTFSNADKLLSMINNPQ